MTADLLYLFTCISMNIRYVQNNHGIITFTWLHVCAVYTYFWSLACTIMICYMAVAAALFQTCTIHVEHKWYHGKRHFKLWVEKFAWSVSLLHTLIVRSQVLHTHEPHHLSFWWLTYWDDFSLKTKIFFTVFFVVLTSTTEKTWIDVSYIDPTWKC